MGKIVVIGSSNTDLVIRTPRIPSPGETLIGSDFMINAGGKGANQAVAAARMGGDVCFVACVGDDGFGAEAVRHYADEGIDTAYIARRNGAASGVALIAVDDAAENSIVVAPGANDLLSPADIDAAEGEIAAADYLLVQLEIPMETVARATELAVRHGVRVILNPAPAAPISLRPTGAVSAVCCLGAWFSTLRIFCCPLRCRWPDWPLHSRWAWDWLWCWA